MSVVRLDPDTREPMIYCKPCGVFHLLPLRPLPGDLQYQRWGWDGNVDEPTFYPSGLFKLRKGHRCHFQVVQGQVIYQPDCTHAYAGQTHQLMPPP